MEHQAIEKLTSSWTKYDSVKVVETTMEQNLEKALNKQIELNEPILRNYLGIDNLEAPLPHYWSEIYKYPKQLGPFALMAAVFTHYRVIGWFAKVFNQGNMSGTFYQASEPEMQVKEFTNLRSALVVSKVADSFFRRKKEVPYDLSLLFESGEVGLLMKDLLTERLQRIGYTEDTINANFLGICEFHNFPAAFSLTVDQFGRWMLGNGLSNSIDELERNGITYAQYGRIRALKTKQWLEDWDNVPNYGYKNRRKPPAHFYQFNIPALLLKRIYEVHSRQATVGRKDEVNIQRKHSEQRSNEIREFVHGGYPWSTISKDQRATEAYKNLQMPGWLPTSIIANILHTDSIRKQKAIKPDEIIQIEDIDENFAEIILPRKIWTDAWTPLIPPVEIIDGQHRIKAFDYIRHLKGNYEFPVIAFDNLDFTWQAYLFYTINIKPKRINTSLAYDLMPLLRIQDWLEHDLNGPDIYRKVRAQELTELLWDVPESPWFNRINMLGETGLNKGGPVTQNAFINSLIVTFVKKWEGKIGGLYGGELHEGEQDVIQWDKETQAAYMIVIWKAVSNAIGRSKAEWVTVLKSRPETPTHSDLPTAFVHSQSFFTTDQGIRPILYIFNDMSFIANDEIGLNKYTPDIDYEKFSTREAIGHIVIDLRKNQIINDYINAIATEIVDNFDWRTPSAFDPKIPEEDRQRQHQNQFRGSGGYKEMRVQLLRILSNSDKMIEGQLNPIKISDIAQTVQQKLGL
jgi:DGQHR domain-containing protein